MRFYNGLKNRLYSITRLKYQSDNYSTCCEKRQKSYFFNSYKEFKLATWVSLPKGFTILKIIAYIIQVNEFSAIRLDIDHSCSFLGSIYQPLFGKGARAPCKKESKLGSRQWRKTSLVPFWFIITCLVFSTLKKSFILLMFIIL